jgi:hypothetical protein
MIFSMCRTIFLAALLALPWTTSLAAQDASSPLQVQYEHETDAVRKARLLAKLGDEQVSLARKQSKSGDAEAALKTLERYRDEVLATFQALKATGINAEKKPAGFKELQISLRETTRRVDDLIFALPADQQQFFREVRSDLGKAQNDLFELLFPRGPGQSSKRPNG